MAEVMVGVLSGAHASLNLSGLPSCCRSIVTTELQICRVSCSSAPASVNESSLKSSKMVSFFVFVPKVWVPCHRRVIELTKLLFVVYHSYRWLAQIFWIVDVVQVPVFVLHVIGINFPNP